MSTRRSRPLHRRKPPGLLIALVTAIAVLLSSTGIRPALAGPTAEDQVVTHNFENPALAAEYVRQFDEIKAKGQKLSQALEERTKGHLQDVMPNLRYIEFDAETKVEGTVATIVIKAPDAVVDATWWQGALIVAGSILIGVGAGAACAYAGGPATVCAGVGGFMGEFVNGALTQWADGKLGDADEWANTMAKSIAAGLTTFAIAWAGTAEALAWYKATSASIIRFVRTVEAFFGGHAAGDALAGMLDTLERYLPSYLRSASSANGVCREPDGNTEPSGWAPLGQIVMAAQGAQTRFMDVDGDRDVDRAVTVQGRLYTWQNAGCGSDGRRVWLPIGDTAPASARQTPKPAFFGDLDGDGKDDLVNFLTSAESGTGFAAMRVWRNESNGKDVRWANPVIVANDLGYVGNPVFADLDGDKDDDIIIPDRLNFLTAWRNTTTGGLPKPGNWSKIDGFTHPAEGPTGSVSYPDINGDGKADVVVVRYTTGDVDAWINLGSGWGDTKTKANKATADGGWKSLGRIRAGNAFGGTVGDFGDLDADKVSDFLLYNSTSQGVDGWLLPSDIAAAANGGVGDPMEAHPGGDDGGTRPGASGDCRPDGLATTAGVATPYCKVYQSDGREWLGQGRDRRVVAYFNGGRTGADGTPHYLVKNIPWSKVTHINYAFASVEANKISVGAAGPTNPAIGMEWPGQPGAEMDTSLPYKGHFNLLTKYKRLHPRVKTMISVGGWAGSGGFYSMTTNSDGSVNQAGINTFSSSVVDFLRTYGFNGVDIDFEYPTVLDDTGNPTDWGTSNPRRKGLPASYAALMKTLRDSLNRASVADDKYYLLTSASTASGYLTRGMANQTALDYQDFTNLMAYDYHGTWNDVVGPNAALFDDGKDPELADLYATPEYGGIGYFNTSWAMKYMRGALQAGRVNIGIPYYTRGWKNVTGGTNGLWGNSKKPGGCEPGTGIKRPCGDGAIGIDNIWHDETSNGGELGSGTNPLWHTKNLEKNILPKYAPNVGLRPGTDEADRISGQYNRFWDNTTKTSWLWNADKKVFLSTEDEQGIDAVTDLVKSTGAGGVMMWELGGDYACPAVVDAQHPCGMGYTLTTRLNEKLGNSGASDNSLRTGSTGTAPTVTANISVDMVNYPTETAKLWPLTPTVRITNNTGRTLGGGKDTKLSFDIPASTSPLVKDVNWQTGAQGGQWQLTPGSPFHRITTTLDYCQIIPAGKTLDLPIIYYLPITGPVNTSLSIGGTPYAPVTDNLKGLGTATPPAGGCSAGNWDSTKVYDPTTQAVEQVTVKYNGKVWKAKWWTQNNAPGTGPDPDHEPWKLIGPAS